MLDYPKVKKMLRKQGFSQKEVADELNVSQTAVSDWLKGEAQPSKQHLDQLAEFLETEVEELVTEKPQVSISDECWGIVVNIHCEHQTINIKGDSTIDADSENDPQIKKQALLKINHEILQQLDEKGISDVNQLVNDILKSYLDSSK